MLYSIGCVCWAVQRTLAVLGLHYVHYKLSSTDLPSPMEVNQMIASLQRAGFFCREMCACCLPMSGSCTVELACPISNNTPVKNDNLVHQYFMNKSTPSVTFSVEITFKTSECVLCWWNLFFLCRSAELLAIIELEVSIDFHWGFTTWLPMVAGLGHGHGAIVQRLLELTLEIVATLACFD